MRRLTDVASNDNDDRLEGISRGLLAAARRRVDGSSFDALERSLLETSNQVLRLALESVLNELAGADDEVIEVRGSRYRRHQKAPVKYHSLCGGLRVERWTYRLIGVRNGPTIVPLELRAGLIERATPALAFALAHGYAKAPMRSVHEDLVTSHRVPPSRATMERMAKSIGTAMKDAVMTIERDVRAAEGFPESTAAVSLGLDRTSVPMEEDDEEDSSKVVVRYRMAYVGTVALTDKTSEVLASWRYAVPACEGPDQVVQRMMNDLRKALRKRPSLHIGVVQDGAYDMWATMGEAMSKELGPSRKWREAIDMYHLMERLSQALEVVERNADKRAGRLRRWKKQLLRDDGTIARIARFFELPHPWLRSEQKRARQGYLAAGYTIEPNLLLGFAPKRARRPPPPPPRRWSERQAKEIDRILYSYLSHPGRFRYASVKRLGLHVGSGVTEGACKSLICARAKRSGQRWRPPGISAVLTLRSLLASDRFATCWKHFAKRYSPTVLAA